MAEGSEGKSSTSSDKSSSTPAALTSLETATNRIRDTAKWLLTAFGAVGVVLVAGVALRDMARVTEDPVRLMSACLSIAVAVSGVIIAILSAGSVVTKSFVTIDDLATEEKLRKEANVTSAPSEGAIHGMLRTMLRNRLARKRRTSLSVTDPLLLGGFDDVGSLWQSYSEALRVNREALCSLYEHQGQELHSAPSVKDEDIIGQYDATTALLQRKAEAAANLVRFHDQVCEPLLVRQSFLQVRAAYRGANKGMGVGVALAVLGVLGFVITTTQPISLPVVGKTPIPVTVVLKQSQQRFIDALGGTCDLAKAISGTAIAAEGNITVVAVPATENCKESILRLSPEDAVIRQASQT